MPVKRKGKTIYHKVGGKWKKKATAGSMKKAKRMQRLLNAVAHGWKPTRRRRKK